MRSSGIGFSILLVSVSMLLGGVLFTPSSVRADETETPEEGIETSASHPRLVAAGWCPVVRDGEAEEDGRPGCDVGLGLALGSWRRLAVVAVVGTDSVGTGFAWVVRDAGGPAIAVAVGVVAPYDDTGVYADRLAPALGITLNWRGAR